MIFKDFLNVSYFFSRLITPKGVATPKKWEYFYGGIFSNELMNVEDRLIINCKFIL
jgi:hypothetical protein